LIFDLHVHTNVGSADSIIDPEDIVKMARQAGLDGVCITEHGVSKSDLAEKLSLKNGILVLSGIEATTDLGDILIFGVDSYPRNMFEAQDLREFVKKAGGVMVAAHPFRSELTDGHSADNLTLETASRRPLFQLVDAIETANGWSSERDAEFCRQLGERLKLGQTGGSDAHISKQIGCCVTIFSADIRSEADLVRELKRGQYRAVDRRSREQKEPAYWVSQ
jgi:predicted metal-dependent phosphoesterase TrpH